MISDLPQPVSLNAAIELGATVPLETLAARASRLRDAGFGTTMTYSPKVFIPLTELCRDVCHYCTFAKTPRHLRAPFLELDEVLALAREGEAAGCREALFTLGEKPERRYRVAREWLGERGYRSTVDYLHAAASMVLRETALIPHINAGTLSRSELKSLRTCGASMGIMLESGTRRLTEPGQPHHGSPDKRPWRRLATLVRAGQSKIPMTTGLLIGIGETREERLRDLLWFRRLHQRYGHIQEVIIQNFRAKADTLMAASAEPDTEELCWTIAMARLILGPGISIQTPPNLNPGAISPLIRSGVNDWGGISAVTPDHVNPEAPWPAIAELSRQTLSESKRLVARLTVYPHYLRHPEQWLEPEVRSRCLASADSEGLLRDFSWFAGEARKPAPAPLDSLRSTAVNAAIERCASGRAPSKRDLEILLTVRGGDQHAVFAAADALRREQAGDAVTFVVNRNINYTNVCQYACQFCAFSKGAPRSGGRERAYDIDGGELLRRSREAWNHGATEICLQGGIHPDYTGNTYLDILSTLSSELPALHLHAFSPLEVMHGAQTLGLSLRDFLHALKNAGLNTLPGTAAEILTDRVRRQICPDKLTADDWLTVMRTAHRLGLRTTATMMFGHVDTPADWAEHLLKVRALQEETGGFTEFVPLPFVAREAPIALRGAARHGPTLREAMLVHAVARLALGPVIPNIQASWVKMGKEHALDCLSAGANDLGGTLINESITRAAGAAHGQCWSAAEISNAVEALGRPVRIRRTDYRDAPHVQAQKALQMDAIVAEPVNLTALRRARPKVLSAAANPC